MIGRIYNSFMRRIKTRFSAEFRTAIKTEKALWAEEIKVPVITEPRRQAIVMIIGPRHISLGAKHARLKAIEDLFNCLKNAAEIHWVTSGFTPEIALDCEVLCKSFNVTHHITENPLILSGRKDISLYQTFKIAKKIRPDVITNISGYLKFGLQASIIGRALQTRTVIRVPGDEVRSRELKKANNRRNDRYSENRIFNRAHHLIAMSENEKKRLQKIAPETDVTIIKRGVDTGLFKVQPLNTTKNRPINVLFVGRNSQEKGRDFLKSLIAASSDQSIKFTLVGDFNPADPIWKKAHIHRSVPVNDMPNVYAENDLLISCSITEGFPQVFAESLACGRPILMPDSLLPEEFSGAEFIFRSPLSVEAYLEKILSVQSSLSESETLSEQAGAYARNVLSHKLWQAGYRRVILQG